MSRKTRHFVVVFLSSLLGAVFVALDLPIIGVVASAASASFLYDAMLYGQNSGFIQITGRKWKP